MDEHGPRGDDTYGWASASLHPGKVLLGQMRAHRPGGGFLATLPLLPPSPQRCAFCAPSLDTATLLELRPDPTGVLPWMAAALHNISPMLPEPAIHEVIVAGPDHDTHLLDPQTDIKVSAAVLRLWADRMARIAGTGAVPVAFSNHGLLAGATQPHPHLQVLGAPGESNASLFERDVLRPGRCLLCDPERALTIGTIGSVRAVAVARPRIGHELVLAPVWHAGGYSSATDQTLADLAELLAELGGIMLERLGRFAYNLVVHQGAPGFHWHLHLLPRLGIPSGIELVDAPLLQTSGLRTAALLSEREP